MKTPEILSPAGNMEKLKFALEYGADAVYLSGKHFGLRTFAGNFTDEQLREAAELIHKKNKKMYVTVNIFASNSDIEEVKKHMQFLKEIKADAMIISDLGVMAVAAEAAPGIPVHVSVQANSLNYKTVEAWKKLGASRVILARELSFEQIKEIREKVKDIELEIFVHGAICMSLSGRCLLSNYMTGRDSNKGGCAQSCRWNYALVEEKRPGEYLPVVEDERGTYIFNSKDLRSIEKLEEFISIGIDSFKIEGRMKSVHYAAVTTAMYKKARDMYLKDPVNYRCSPEWLKELDKISHREYTTGFYFNDGKLKQNTKTSEYIEGARYLGFVDETKNSDVFVTKVNNSFKTGETLEILSPDGNVFPLKVKNIINSDGMAELYAKQDTVYSVQYEAAHAVKPFSILRK